VDDEEPGRAFQPPFGAWWIDPARLLPPGLPVAPVAALESLLRAAGRRLAGRHLTVPGTGGALRLRLTALRIDPEPVGLTIGQLGEVTVEATEVVWRDLTFRRAVLVARNVHVRPQPVPTAVAAPVVLDVVVDPAVLRERLAARHPQLRLEVHGDVPHARAHWARRPEWGWVGLRPEVTSAALLLRPTTVSVRDDQRLVTDGPFAETKEHLAGFYVIDVPSLDDAIEAAARVPSAKLGKIEIRPIAETG